MLTFEDRLEQTRAARAAEAREREAAERSQAIVRARWAEVPPAIQAEILGVVKKRLGGREPDPAKLLTLTACMIELDRRAGTLKGSVLAELLPF